MKFVKSGLSLLLLGAGLAAVPSAQSAAAGQAPASSEGSLVQRMRSDASGQVRVSTERATGKVGFIRSTGDLLPSLEGDSAKGATTKARSYLDKYAAAFGATAGQLSQSGMRSDRYGWTVDFTQSYKGVNVWSSELHAQIDKQGDLTSVNGFVAPDLNLSVTPKVSASQAASRALAFVTADPPLSAEGTANLSGIKAVKNDLRIYRTGAVKGEIGKSILAYVVEVSNGKNIREVVVIDALAGKPVNRYSMINDALDRRLYEASLNDGGTPDDGSDDTVDRDLVWTEGDAFPGTLDQNQQNEVLSTGESYWLYKNSFGYDSFDNAGSTMITVNNDPDIACPNANWNGVSTNYCDGVTSDDTVSHEWGHAYTEYTSGLVYQWQPGAMNESYSDIWGETVDILNDRFNETPDTARTAGTCSAYTRGEVGVTINAPATIAKECVAAPAGFGPTITKGGTTADIVLAKDAVEADGTASDGCSPFTNSAVVAGKFALVDRGLCPFGDKAGNAEDAGAIGIIIGNRDEEVFSPSGGIDEITIPGAMIQVSDRELIKTALAEGKTVNITLKDIDEATKDDSYRWLSGESDPAFGGAIRDMWNPTCYGDPGKLSDAEYKCGEDDGGGVHSNSGVPNHVFALLVDGGTYNGVTVPAIGLDKAANLFWRTQLAHLTATSDFADLADGLAASCTELTAQPINTITIEPNAVPTPATPITSADCAAVASVAQATELDQKPVACNFAPLQNTKKPATCGKGFSSRSFFTERFSDGLKGWSRSKVADNADGTSYPWVVVEAPGARTGKVIGSADPDASCATDITSSDAITSPAIRMPAGVARKMSFDHYVATESTFDGGNVLVSVAGKAFKVVATGAYIYNKPQGSLLTADEGNSNPKAGQVAFNGTDGGTPKGSWATSVINLNKIGAKAGQKVKFRFEMGRDQCSGTTLGWYVDNVKVTTCKAKTKTSAQARSGNRAMVAVKVTRAGSKGDAPRGIAKLFNGDRRVGKSIVKNGKAIVMVRGLARGTYKLTVKFAGGAFYMPSSDTVKVTVR